MAELIGNVLNKFLEELGIERSIKGYQALSMWSEVVGKRIAGVTHPVRIVDQKIFVEVETDSWRNELFYHKSDIMAKINEKLGSKVIKDIVLL